MRWVRRALRGVVLAVLLAVCAVLFYLLVIMGDTPGPDLAPEPTASLSPLQALPQGGLAFPAGEIGQAAAYFPAPLLRLSETAGWRLEGIEVRDAQVQGIGEAVREVRLRYAESGTGAAVEVSSLTPSRYLRCLPARGFLAATDQDWTLAGLKAVLMSDGRILHLHAERGDIVYQIEGEVGVEVLKRASSATELR